MKIALVNESTRVATDTLVPIAQAVQDQLYECYAVLWEANGCPVTLRATLADVQPDESIVAVLDNADQADALGYHDVTPDGRPYGRVFAAPVLDNGGTLSTGSLSVSAVISHEVLEMVGDPYATWWSDGPRGQEYALELADPVEGDSYDINGIAVSNFVGPRYFSLGAGPYDYMGQLSAPFTMSPGGYLIVRTSGSDVKQIFGDAFPEWKKDGKKHAAARTAKRCASR